MVFYFIYLIFQTCVYNYLSEWFSDSLLNNLISFIEVFAFHRGDGACHVRFLLSTITYDDDAEEVTYSDHAGGVKSDEMGVFLGLGQSKDTRADGRNIGAFGLGTKKALNRLANKFTIASRHEDADQGWKYTVDEDFFAEDNETWEFEMEPADLDPGQTVITLHDLTFNWDEEEETADEAPDAAGDGAPADEDDAAETTGVTKPDLPAS